MSTVKALMPFQSQVRQLKRRIAPYQDNPNNSRLALTQGLEQIQLLRKAGANLSGDVLEFGSGWLPIIPLLFHLSGARRLILTDVERLLDARTIDRAKSYIRENAGTVARTLDKSSAEVIAELNADFAPSYLVPWDSTTHPSCSVDVIASRTVLEHIPPASLDAIFGNFRRILRPGGFMCHIVDNSDHWEHRDKSLSRINFLRYEDDWFWRLACFNTQDYQNRWRHSDYMALFRRQGWQITLSEGEPDAKCLADVSTLPLAAKFVGRDPRDLAILTSTFVLRSL